MGWNAGVMCDMSVLQLEMLSKEMAQHANYTAGECMPPNECTRIAELTHTCVFRTEGVVADGGHRGTSGEQVGSKSQQLAR